MKKSQTSIVIADSSTISRLGLNAIVNQMDGFIVVGEAENSKGVLDLIIAKSPDLVIIDFLSDDFDIETIISIKRRFPNLLLLGITPLQNGNTLINALRAGIDSYIKKSCDIPEVVDAIESTSKGKSFYCGKILEKIRKESIDVSEMNNIDLSCDAVALSRREKEILTLTI